MIMYFQLYIIISCRHNRVLGGHSQCYVMQWAGIRMGRKLALQRCKVLKLLVLQTYRRLVVSNFQKKTLRNT